MFSDIQEMTQAVLSLDEVYRGEFILVGGASMILRGSLRVTMDIDLLLPRTSVQSLESNISTTSGKASFADGVYYVNGDHSKFPIDFLTDVVDGMSFEKLVRLTEVVGRGIKVPNLPVSLGIKIRCFYLRSDEAPRKKLSDIEDIIYISRSMKELGISVDEGARKLIPVGCYNMLLVKAELRTMGSLVMFETVGGGLIEVPFEDNTPEQKEYYEMMMEEGEDEEDEKKKKEDCGTNS